MSVSNPVNVRIKKLNVGTLPKTFLTFDLQPEKIAATDDAVHHIHILDRSGSMRGHIEALMDDVKKTLDLMSENDFVTIIWFSGAGEYRTVIKCAKNDPQSIGKILDSLKSVVGCTCFSDPIKELEQIVSETYAVCNIFNVTIFTDGDTVTPWPIDTEAHRIFSNLDTLKEKITAFNAVGYGNYYNRDLLLKMTKTTGFGQLVHASKIEEYSDIFNKNKKAVCELSPCRVSLFSPDAEIVCLSPQSIKLFNEKADIRLGKKGNTVGIVANTDSNIVKIVINGTTHTFDTDKIPVSDFAVSDADILYAYAYALYYDGQRKQALEVLNLIGDKTLMDKQHSAFTVSETGEYLKTLQNCAFNRGKRHILQTESNSYLPDENAFCVFDVLKKLVELDAEYFPAENYQRVGRKVIDEFNCFIKDESSQSVNMRGIVLNQERLNISIRFEVNGKVKLNPKRAKSVGLPAEVDAKIYRVHTIIRDGSLNMDAIKVKLKKASAIKFLDDLKEHKQIIIETDDEIILNISLSGLPVINSSYLTGFNAKKLLLSEIEMLKLEAEIKVLNALLKEDGTKAHEPLKHYTPQQTEVLKEHGISADMVYSSISPTRLDVEDYYVVKEFRTALKGFSALPSLNKVLSKKLECKKLTMAEEMINEYYTLNKTLNTESILAKKLLNQKALNALRFELAGAKLALVLTGEWLNDLQATDDGSYTYSDSDYTLNVKLERKELPI